MIDKSMDYNVGIYIRLSREDDDKTLESESITNQRSFDEIEEYFIVLAIKVSS